MHVCVYVPKHGCAGQLSSEGRLWCAPEMCQLASIAGWCWSTRILHCMASYGLHTFTSCIFVSIHLYQLYQLVLSNRFEGHTWTLLDWIRACLECDLWALDSSCGAFQTAVYCVKC